MEQKEALILQKVREGDVDSFRWIVENYHRKVYQYCFRFIRNKEVVEEITSDVFVKLWGKRDHLQAGRAISGLLFKIARDYAIDYLRKAARDKTLRKSFLARYKETIENPVEESIHYKETRAIADEAIDRLPPRRRLVFQLRYQEDMSNQQIAQILNISPHTVRVHLVKASRFVRDYLRTNAYSALLFILWLA